MTLKYSLALRNNQLDQIESTTGTSPRLRLYNGFIPNTCDDPINGILLVDISLPPDWMSAAASGEKAKLGVWTGVGTLYCGSGTHAQYFRITDSTGEIGHIQGDVTILFGGGELMLDNTFIAENQVVTVSTFVISAGNP